MRNEDAFSGCHPIINFLYFGLVLVFTMFFMHPLCLAVSLASALSYSVYLGGKKALGFSFSFVLPMMLLAAVLNPAFNHQGSTILAFLPTGNPLTLESIAYGLASAAMLGSVVVWFGCCGRVMSGDKFICLFGRIAPALSLTLSMTLGFVPKFTNRIKAVARAQRCIGRDASGGSPLRRARHGLTILSIMVTWSLEDAIETADSMKSRGYGLRGRTAFSVYTFDSRDKSVLLWLLFCGGYTLSGWLAGGLFYRYFPVMEGVSLSPFPLSFILVYLALCLTPLIFNLKEGRKWTYLQSKT